VSTEDKSWEPLSLFHFTVNARNFERSLEFYRKLGFRILRDNRDIVWPDYVATQFGLERAQGRGALLGLGDGPDCTRLDLLQWLEPAPERESEVPVSKRVPRILAIRTRGVRAAYEDLRSQGIEFVTPPRGPDAPTGIEAVVCCRDPDGLLVELIEYMPGVLGSRIENLETRSGEDLG
jgi:catechol 2,3-dioxygenase-like lactoylglutathione lyase family enzyme